MVECELPKLDMWVRFPSPAPTPFFFCKLVPPPLTRWRVLDAAYDFLTDKKSCGRRKIPIARSEF